MTWLWFWLVDEPPDMRPRVAVEFAYQLTRPEIDVPVVPIEKDPDPNCPDCRGTGKIKTGDGISWTRCDCTLQRSQPNAPTTQEHGSSRSTPKR